MTRDEAWNAMMAIAGIEQTCIDMRKLMCDGSFLKGHTVKDTITPEMLRTAWNLADTLAEQCDRFLKAMGDRP